MGVVVKPREEGPTTPKPYPGPWDGVPYPYPGMIRPGNEGIPNPRIDFRRYDLGNFIDSDNMKFSGEYSNFNQNGFGGYNDKMWFND